MTIEIDVKKQAVPALIDLYILDLNPIGIGEVYYFYPDTTPEATALVYLGQTYSPWPVEITGFSRKGDGAETRPSAKISNYGGAITALLQEREDLIGASLTRRRTLKTYVDANLAQYFDELYFIEQKTSENPLEVSFDLANAMDFLDKKLPGRIAIANACPWRYRSTANGSGCGWPATNPAKWFDADGNPVTTLAEDNCGHRLSDCKLRFGANNPLDFGGFPSLGRSG